MNKSRPFVILTATSKIPSSWKWNHKYGKIAVIQTDGEKRPKQIHPNHSSVVRIVDCWDRLYIGVTDKCQFKRVMKEAQVLCEELNDSYEILHKNNIFS